MFGLKNLSLLVRGVFFVMLMAVLGFSVIRGEAGPSTSTIPLPDTDGFIVVKPVLAPVPVVDTPFRITDAGELQRWTTSEWVTVTDLPSRTTTLATFGRSIAYVGTEALGVFKSTDTGQTWTAVNNAGLGLVPGSVLDITALTVDSNDANHVLAATAYLFGSTQVDRVPAGVYESIDGGATWRVLIEGRLPGTVTELTLDPNGLVVAHWEAQGDLPLGLTTD